MSDVAESTVAEALRLILDRTASGALTEDVARTARDVVIGLWIDGLADGSAERFVATAATLASWCESAARNMDVGVDRLQRASMSAAADIAEREVDALRAAAGEIRKLVN